MKKLLCMLLALTVVLVAFAGIASAEEAANWKIAIMTGTTSQGEEEFRAAEALKEQYPDNVITDTYPDQFMACLLYTSISGGLCFLAARIFPPPWKPAKPPDIRRAASER